MQIASALPIIGLAGAEKKAIVDVVALKNNLAVL
jgi:hypothetical protein